MMVLVEFLLKRKWDKRYDDLRILLDLLLKGLWLGPYSKVQLFEILVIHNEIIRFFVIFSFFAFCLYYLLELWQSDTSSDPDDFLGIRIYPSTAIDQKQVNTYRIQINIAFIDGLPFELHSYSQGIFQNWPHFFIDNGDVSVNIDQGFKLTVELPLNLLSCDLSWRLKGWSVVGGRDEFGTV